MVGERSGGRLGERVFCGVSGYRGSAVAVGRLCIAENMQKEKSRCIPCVCEIPDGRLLDLLDAHKDIAGIALCGQALSPELMELLIFKEIPYIILKDSGFSRLGGQIAVLDTERGVLITDPDIDTLERYSAAERAVWSREGGELGESAEWERGGRGVIVDVLRIEASGDLGTVLTSLTELLCGWRISIRIGTPHGAADEELFCRRIEAVYRAAVYGSLSVELCGYAGEADIERAVALMHRVFCELESAGREFNGYIRKGLLIDMPVWLLRPTPFPRADHITLDLDKIIAGLVGESGGELSEEQSEAVYSLWDRYFSRFAPECAMRVRSDLPADSLLLKACMVRADVDTVYGKTEKSY